MAEIFLDKNAAVIYEIANLVNGRCYVGSTMAPRKRRRQHWNLLRQWIHHCVFLQRDWNIHGEDAFLFTVVEVVGNTADLLVREQAYLTHGTALYNVSRSAVSIFRGRSHTAETRQRIREASLGRSHTPETRAKISAALKGRKTPWNSTP